MFDKLKAEGFVEEFVPSKVLKYDVKQVKRAGSKNKDGGEEENEEEEQSEYTSSGEEGNEEQESSDGDDEDSSLTGD